MALLKIGKIQQGGGNAHSCHWLRESHDLLEAMRFSAPVLRMNKLASHPDGLGEKKKRAQVRDVQTNRRKDPPPPETALKKKLSGNPCFLDAAIVSTGKDKN